ncbi:alpha/beta hydrolase [Spongiibacter sp. KMU-158]|uniref:Alpha/beta hydrolase n=1 Tax=Spongiibacter pelagi TaxID=2760804 RepID=A0A927C0D1_9GAMM|nr:alpha/beta hydrolase [Spongiibacter pelagi]MBD2857707.1 alpha/beta hydrolase [Spongiibacter pelagi]
MRLLIRTNLLQTLKSLGLGLCLIFTAASCAMAERLPDGIIKLADISYGTDKRQAIDVYRPKNASNAPIIVMVHGGAWRIGDKDNRTVVNNKLARWGSRDFVFISVNYRLLPDADPLMQAGDVAMALAYIQSHAAQWGGDPSKLVLMGHSAGAHLVSLLAVSPDRVMQRGGHNWLATISLDTAAFDIVKVMENPHPRFYDRAFGSDPSYWRSASPLHQLKDNSQINQLRPMMIVCSTEREDKPCDGAEVFASELQNRSVMNTVLPLAMSHREINADLGKNEAYTKSVEDFMAQLDKTISKLLQ